MGFDDFSVASNPGPRRHVLGGCLVPARSLNWSVLMLADVLNTTSVLRLRGLLESRFGKTLKVNFMVDARSIDSTPRAILTADGHLCVPIFSHGQFLATALVQGGSALAKEDQETVISLVSMVLEPALYNWKMRQQSFVESDEVRSNVISLHHEDDETVSTESLESEESRIKSFSTNVMFLQSRGNHVVVKVADEIHAFSGRWAFLRFSHIQSQVQSAADIRSLGQATILVEDILTLAPEHQSILVDYLNSVRRTSDPLLLIASTSSLRDLENHQMIHPVLLSHLKQCVVEVDRLPTRLEILREAIELFLEPQENL